jgi:hypothetical protein
MLKTDKQSAAPEVDTDRYRPMLRLLSDDDADLMTGPASRARRRQRTDLFREYLRCLSGDYGRLLAGIRAIMSQSSSIDRPDLAKALLRNRVGFVIALCRIDLRLRLYGLGIGRLDALKPDVMGLVAGLDVLRGQFSLVAESAAWGS